MFRVIASVENSIYRVDEELDGNNDGVSLRFLRWRDLFGFLLLSKMFDQHINELARAQR